MDIYDAMKLGREKFLRDLPRKEPKKKPPVPEPVVPWWITKGYESLADAMVIELAKARAIQSTVVLPAGFPDQLGRTYIFDIRADAADLMEIMIAKPTRKTA